MAYSAIFFTQDVFESSVDVSLNRSKRVLFLYSWNNILHKRMSPESQMLYCCRKVVFYYFTTEKVCRVLPRYFSNNCRFDRCISDRYPVYTFSYIHSMSRVSSTLITPSLTVISVDINAATKIYQHVTCRVMYL